MKRMFFTVAALVLCSGMSVLATEKAPASAQEAMPSLSDDSGRAPQLSGKVVETMDAGGYTYVCIEKNGKKTWVAVPQMKVKKGEHLSFQPGQVMTNFTSKSLNRTFDEIVFSAGPVASGSGSMPSGHPSLRSSSGTVGPGSKGLTTAKDTHIKVGKASGANACTVAEAFAKAGALNGKNVTIKGKVVKFSQGIMNKNWIHLQDGTGDPKQGTHDLVVTTLDSASKGDVVTITGTLVKDKDFGAGYSYKVIVEDASVKK